MPPPPDNEYTEAEAQLKRCVNPQLAIATIEGTFYGIVSNLGTSIDRAGLREIASQSQHDIPHPLVRCVASNCMAWQWKNATEGYCGIARSKTG